MARIDDRRAAAWIEKQAIIRCLNRVSTELPFGEGVHFDVINELQQHIGPIAWLRCCKRLLPSQDRARRERNDRALLLASLVMGYQVFPLFPSDSSPLLRLLLSAQGTLQLILRAYFNAEILILVLSHAITQLSDAHVVERVIKLVANDRVLCVAKSVTRFPSHMDISNYTSACKFNLGKIFHTFDQDGQSLPFDTQLLYYAYRHGDRWTVSKPEVNYETQLAMEPDLVASFGPMGARRIYEMKNAVISSLVYEMFPADLFQ